MPSKVTDMDFFNALQARPAEVARAAKPQGADSETRAADPVAPDACDFFSPSASTEPEEAESPTPDPRHPTPEPDPDRSGWTIPLLCAGIGIIACCVLIPAADDNRRLVYEREKLKADLTQLQTQIDVNQEFLNRIVSDPTLAERLARRQMKMVREGTAVLHLTNDSGIAGISPFEIVAVPPPAPMPDYQPVAGRFAALCRNPKSQLLLLGMGLLLSACGLVLGGRASLDPHTQP